MADPIPKGRTHGQTASGMATATVSADLQPREGEATIADTEALKILESRFGTTIPGSSAGDFWRGSQSLKPWEWGYADKGNAITDARRDLLSRIVRMIPIEQRTASVFQFVDIRPILQELMQTEQQARVSARSMTLNGVPVGPEARVEAGLLLVEQNKVIEDQAFALAATKDFATDAERHAFINEFVYSYRNNEGLSATPELALQATTPEGTLATPEQSAAQQQIKDLPLYERYLAEAGLIEDSTQPYQFMDDQHIQWMFRMNMVDWNGLLESEAAKAQARRQGDSAPADFMVDTGGVGGMSGTPDLDRNLAANGGQPYMRPGAPQPTSKVRLLDVFNSLYSSQWTTQELRNLQDKLLAAGYIEKPEDIRWNGKNTDPATIDAWKRLVVDSVNSGVDMNTLLKDATVAKRLADDEEDKRTARDIVLTSAVGIRQTANSLGQQTIGRELTPEQQAQVVEYIHNLERGMQTTVAREGSQTVEDVDVEAEVKAFIERENSTEKGAMDLLNQFNTFQTVARRRG